MPRFLIEVAHEASPIACTKAVQALLRTGSHFLTHADWGCKDGVHKSWITMDLDTRHDALNVVPMEFRKDATVIQLNWFTLDKDGKVRESAVAAHRG